MKAGSFVIAVLLTATSAFAHHSNSAFDPDKVVVLKGTVTQWMWTNPHVWICLVGRRRQGQQDGVGDRGPSPGVLARAGWSKTIFKARRHDHRGFQPGEGRQPHRPHHARHACRWHRALEQRRRLSKRGSRGGHHVEDRSAAFHGARVLAAWIDGIGSRAGDAGATGLLRACIYHVQSRTAAAAVRGTARGGPPPRPVAVIDGRAGRPDTRAETDAGVPGQMGGHAEVAHGRIVGDRSQRQVPLRRHARDDVDDLRHGDSTDQRQDHDLRRAERRVSTDFSRRPQAATARHSTIRRSPGYSVGHWEGDTLVVDTVALREDTLLDLFSPHSDQLTVHERIRFTSPGILEDRITANGSESAARTLHSDSYVSESVAAERRAARVLVCGGIGVREVGLPWRCRRCDALEGLIREPGDRVAGDEVALMHPPGVEVFRRLGRPPPRSRSCPRR